MLGVQSTMSAVGAFIRGPRMSEAAIVIRRALRHAGWEHTIFCPRWLMRGDSVHG